MSTLPYAITDSATMLRRSLRHMQRYPSLTVLVAGMPVVFMLLFVYVFGGTLGSGIGGAAGGRAFYVNYVVPGILLVAVAAAAQGTAVSVAMDMTEGIIARFRTMAIARVSVLTGHVLGSMIKTAFGLVVVTGVALLIGFRPTAGPLAWLAVIGLLAAFTFALTWLTVALGLAAKTVESASNTPMFLMLLPFLSALSSPPSRCRPACGRSPNTSRSRPSPRRSGGCSPAPRSAATASSPWPGAPASRCASYLWARKLFSRDPIR